MICNECAEAVPGHDIQIHIKPGKLAIQIVLEPHPQEDVGPSPTSSTVFTPAGTH